jgi:hypothetical protein
MGSFRIFAFCRFSAPRGSGDMPDGSLRQRCRVFPSLSQFFRVFPGFSEFSSLFNRCPAVPFGSGQSRPGPISGMSYLR